MQEIFKDIEGFEGLYQISNLGRVKSLRFNKEILLKDGKTGRELGYRSVVLTKNKIKKTYYVHRLVAQAFIPNPENKSDANHKNGIKSDNIIANLEWCTCSENSLHSFRKEGRKATGGWITEEGRKRDKKAVSQHDLNGNLLHVYESMGEAFRRTGIKTGNISSVCKGTTKTGKGFIWKYHKKTAEI